MLVQECVPQKHGQAAAQADSILYSVANHLHDVHCARIVEHIQTCELAANSKPLPSTEVAARAAAAGAAAGNMNFSKLL
jgi:hypothetical protein